ncbi:MULTISPECIES: hypothetical protein [Bacillus]|uniref:Uncharacterized protein n=1 Tax=Bacillus capparidis TaxID=1840411 RepID=A0ABS4CY67_9BACI|nr:MULTISPECIES: hypothetical protein [Bacillus]MBP1082304.1 hypothetical protein [Bacillus capparidis]MED1097435.1 hypothetical protein [Bacillus capparidis]
MNATVSDQASEKELEKVLKFYFEEVGEFTDEGYKVKVKELFNAKVSTGDPAAVRLKELMQTDSVSSGSCQKSEVAGATTSDFQDASATSFGKCVVNKMANSYGNIARQWLQGYIWTYITTKQYDLAARLIFNSLIKAGFKVSAATIAIELGYYGWQCRNEW